MFRLALAGGVMIEGLLIAALVRLTDFSDRAQALIFVGTVGGYTLFAIGLIMLAMHVDRTLIKALQAGR